MPLLAQNLGNYSYAAYTADSENYATEGIDAAYKLVNFFINASPCADWMPELAQRAGLSIAWLTQLHQGIERTVSLDQMLNSRAGFTETLHMLREVIKEIHPVVMVDKFGGKPSNKGITQLQKLPKKLHGQVFDWSINVGDQDFSPELWKHQWDEVFLLLYAWLRGDSFKQIATTFFGLNQSDTPSLFPNLSIFPRSDRSPLHYAIKSIKDISYPLQHISGGFVQLLTKMMQEANLIKGEEAVPLCIGMLPQAIHWGVDQLDKAFWYYNLLPARCVAHACAEAFPTEYENDMQIKAAVIEQAAKLRANSDILLAYPGESKAGKEVLAATATLL